MSKELYERCDHCINFAAGTCPFCRGTGFHKTGLKLDQVNMYLKRHDQLRKALELLVGRWCEGAHCNEPGALKCRQCIGRDALKECPETGVS